MSSRRRGRDEDEEGAELAEPGGRPRKLRRRLDQKEVLGTIKNMMDKLCDCNSETVHGCIEDLTYYAADTMQMYKWDILRILVDCVTRHPMHSAALATFIGLVNVRDYELGSECINCIAQQFLKALHGGEWVQARSLVLLLADLVNSNVLTMGSMLQLLNSLIDVCEEDQCPQRRRDFYAYLVLSTLPNIGRELYEKKEAALEALFKRLELYMKERNASDGSRLLRIWVHSDVPQHEYLELLWLQIMRLQRDRWLEQEVLRTYAAFGEELSGALQHHLPPFQPPRLEDDTLSYPRPWLVFRLFDVNDLPLNVRMLGDLDIGRHMIEAHIMEMLNLYHLERKLCAERLIAYCWTISSMPMEHCVVEVLVGQMLQLPASPLLTINYGCLLIELCKLAPDRFARAVAQAADVLFAQLEFMNVSSFDRFVNWFSHHLSNFRFQWNWQDWASCVSLPELHPSAMFIRELLKKCMRLSYHKHVVQMVPDSFANVVPVSPDPNYKYINGLLPGAKLAKLLLDSMRSKCTPEYLGGLVEATVDLDEALKVDVLMQTFLHLGCKSFTHVLSIINKFQPVLKMVASTARNQQAMLRAVFEVWANNEQVKVVVVEKLVRMHLVSCDVVVAWAFNPALKAELVKMYIWEMLDMIVKYTKNQGRNSDPQHEGAQCLLLKIVQSCSNVISEHHLAALDQQAEFWFTWVLGRLLQLLFNYIDESRAISSQLEVTAADAKNLCQPLFQMFNDYLNYIK